MVGHLRGGGRDKRGSAGRARTCCPECLADPNGADCCLPRARTRCVLLNGGATGNRTPIYAMPLRRLAVGRWSRNGARARIAAPAAMQRALRDWRCALPRSAFAPGKSGFASRRLDDFGIARVWKWGGQRDSHPHDGFHRAGCCSLHHGLHLKLIRLRVPPPSGLAYKASA